MNYALIFAGGTGQRMNTKTRPKQFLELHGKPILVYTIEIFENHPNIDGIVVVCLEEWIPFLKKQINHYDIVKVMDIVPGGTSGQESIAIGIARLGELVAKDANILIHDGVRPLLQPEVIDACITSVKEHGSAVTVTPAIETIVQEKNGKITNVIDRQACRTAKAPQCFKLDDLLDAQRRTQLDGETDFIDTASLMRHYGYPLYAVEGNLENIKITTPSDFYVFRAFVDAKENSQIFGL